MGFWYVYCGQQTLHVIAKVSSLTQNVFTKTILHRQCSVQLLGSPRLILCRANLACHFKYSYILIFLSLHTWIIIIHVIHWHASPGNGSGFWYTLGPALNSCSVLEHKCAGLTGRRKILNPEGPPLRRLKARSSGLHSSQLGWIAFSTHHISHNFCLWLDWKQFSFAK